MVHVGSSTVVSFMTNEDVDGDGRWAYDGAQMKVIVSTDRAQSWGSSVVLAGKGSHWPGLFAVDATHFLALYSKDGYGAMSHVYKLIPEL